jgi:Tol biopolymer transport system component
MRDVCDANGCGEQPDLFVMNADGTGETRLTATLTTEENPAWSADGRKIVFDTYDQGLFTINGDGSGRTRLTSAADTEPAWSPDGTKIAFVRGAGACGGGFYCNTLGDIYVMSADGTGQTRITGRDYVGEFSPNWSPDGTKIAMGYDTVENQEDGPSRFDIVVMNADGTGLVNVTDTALPDEFRPAWSPDGRQIAFDYEACSDSICPQDSVARITSDGSGRADITDPTVFATEPDWQPLPEPRRSNYRDAAKFCEADRQFLGAEAFQAKYGSNGNAANAFGNCVSANR